MKRSPRSRTGHLRGKSAQLVIQAGQPILQKTLPPFADGGFGPMKPRGDLGVALALGRPQHQLGAGDQGVRESAGASQASQLSRPPRNRNGSQPLTGVSMRQRDIHHGTTPATVPGARTKNTADPRMANSRLIRL